MSYLKVSKISKRYAGSEQFALNEIDFQLKKGELLALLGESGCGKTSLLKCIAGLEELDGGTIFLEKEKVNGPAGSLIAGHKGIKMVFQDFKLLPNISVYENVAYPIRKELNVYDKVMRLLHFFNIAHLADKLPKQLSGGEQQRASLARSIADEPMLLLLDEPFSNLDRLMKQQLKKDLEKVLRSIGTTMVMVTHDVRDALAMADRIALMRKGELVQIGKPKEIYENPKDLYTARFFGDVNVFQANYLPANLQKLITAKFPKDKAETSYCLRPEDIKVSSKKTGLSGDILSVHYSGDHDELHIHGTNGLQWIVSVPPHLYTRGGSVNLELVLDRFKRIQLN